MAAKLVLNPILADLETRFQSALVKRAMPIAAKQISELAQAKFIAMVSDGIASGTRAKQTDRVRRRFKLHMNREVKIKPILGPTGVASVTGVDKKVGQVNFDMGEKAKTTGRLHVLWGKAFAKPPLRIQRQEHQDIPLKIQAEMESVATSIITAEILKALGNL